MRNVVVRNVKQKECDSLGRTWAGRFQYRRVWCLGFIFFGSRTQPHKRHRCIAIFYSGFKTFEQLLQRQRPTSRGPCRDRCTCGKYAWRRPLTWGRGKWVDALSVLTDVCVCVRLSCCQCVHAALAVPCFHPASVPTTILIFRWDQWHKLINPPGSGSLIMSIFSFHLPFFFPRPSWRNRWSIVFVSPHPLCALVVWNGVNVDLHYSSVFIRCLVFIVWRRSDGDFWFTEGAFPVILEYSAASNQTKCCIYLILKCTFGRNVLARRSRQYQLWSSRTHHMILQFLGKCKTYLISATILPVDESLQSFFKQLLFLFYTCDSQSHT